VGNTLTEVLFDSARIVTPPDSSFFITVTAIGRQTNWTNLSYQNTPVMTIKKEGVVDNTNGTVTIVSNESNTVVYNNNANSNWELLLGVAPMFKIFVRGSSGADINWTVKAEMIRVS
jgi:hypothetical protein